VYIGKSHQLLAAEIGSMASISGRLGYAPSHSLGNLIEPAAYRDF